MTVKEMYIHIQQGLQNIAAFVYKDLEIEELDYFSNFSVNKLIELVFPTEDDKRNKAYQEIEAVLDDLRVLEVLGTELSLTAFTLGNYTGKKGSIPANYRHLLNDRTILIPIDCADEAAREVPNRLTKTENINNLLENSIYKTSFNSPISRLSGTIIYVYDNYKNTQQFTISKVIIDYLKKPAAIAYGADGSATIEFPDDVCFKIIRIAIIYMSIVAEQNQQKIQNLVSQ